MGSDDIFKKRRQNTKERKKEIRDPKPNSFLIVSEGAKTEPLYFDGLAKHINEKYGQSVSVKKPSIDTKGEGKCTVSLVEATTKFVSRTHNIYSQVWVVFDKDDFEDFDEAIDLAEKRGYKTAWSNQSFEYWIFLHFNYLDAALHRNVIVEKLSDLFRQRGIDPQGYQKSNPEIFEIATKQGSLKYAIKNAIHIEEEYPNNMKPSLCDPCTKVHHLILELKPWLSDLL